MKGVATEKTTVRLTARERLAILLAVVVGMVWSVVAIASVVIGEYTAVTVITPVMLLVVGYAVGVKPGDIISKNGRNGGENGRNGK